MPVLEDDTQTGRLLTTRRKHAAARRTRVLQAGGRRLELLLEANAAASLGALMGASGKGATTVISELLVAAAKRKRLP